MIFDDILHALGAFALSANVTPEQVQVRVTFADGSHVQFNNLRINELKDGTWYEFSQKWRAVRVWSWFEQSTRLLLSSD